MTLRCPADHTGAKKKKRRDRGGIDTIQTVRTRDILIDGIWNWKREYFEETQTLLTTIAKNERKGRLFHAAIKDLLSISLFCWNDDDPDIHSKKCFWWDAHPITAWLSAIHPPSESGVVVVMDWDARGRSSESDWNNASFPLFFSSTKQSRAARSRRMRIYTDVRFPVEAPVNPTRGSGHE